MLSLAALDSFLESFESAQLASSIEPFAEGFEGDWITIAEAVDEDEVFAVVDKVAEIEVAHDDAAFENCVEDGIEILFQLCIIATRRDEEGEGGGQVAPGGPHGFNDESEAQIRFGEAFDFLEEF